MAASESNTNSKNNIFGFAINLVLMTLETTDDKKIKIHKLYLKILLEEKQTWLFTRMQVLQDGVLQSGKLLQETDGEKMKLDI